MRFAPFVCVWYLQSQSELWMFYIGLMHSIRSICSYFSTALILERAYKCICINCNSRCFFVQRKSAQMQQFLFRMRNGYRISFLLPIGVEKIQIFVCLPFHVIVPPPSSSPGYGLVQLFFLLTHMTIRQNSFFEVILRWYATYFRVFCLLAFSRYCPPSKFISWICFCSVIFANTYDHKAEVSFEVILRWYATYLSSFLFPGREEPAWGENEAGLLVQWCWMLTWNDPWTCRTLAFICTRYAC
jgi:hypothetical protein